MKKINRGSRILAILLTLTLLLTLTAGLTSCSSGGSTGGDYVIHTSDKSVDLYLSRTLPLDATAKMQFIAAFRGYDMTAEGFDDTAIEVGKSDTFLYDENGNPLYDAEGNREYNLANVNMAAARAAANRLREHITDEDDLAKFDAWVAGMTAVEVKSTIEIMQDGTKADLTVSNSLVDTLLLWIGKFLQWMTNLTGGYYAISILFFAILIKVLMLPLSIKQQKTQIKQAQLAPKIAAIKAKYKGRTDQVTMKKQQEEIMELQQREGAGCASGCLPLLIQLPIIIALYNIVVDPLRYVLGKAAGLSSALSTYYTTARAAGGLGMTVSGRSNSTITILSAIRDGGNLEGLKSFLYYGNATECYEQLASSNIPNFTLFGIDLSLTPSFTSILVLIPILAAAFSWLSMFLTRRWSNGTQTVGMDDGQSQMSMRMMDIVMPLMTLWLAFSFSGMLGLYWIYQSVVGILQSFVLSRVMPMPHYTEEELREMQKAQKAQEKAQRAAIKSQPKYKSLHYIDEDDYDELPDVKKNPQSKKNTGDLPDIKD